MTKVIKISRGLDIPLKGAFEGGNVLEIYPQEVGLVPDDFPGYKWKASVRPGDSVNFGDPLLVDREGSPLRIVSPVAGKVKEIRRGERRRILAVVVAVSSPLDPASMALPLETDAADLRSLMINSGLWVQMRQRPFDIVPAPDSVPRDIYVTAVDSAPLAPDVISPELLPWLEPGLEALKTLTDGNVYLAVRPGSEIQSKVAEILIMEGPHPAGNVGVQINHTSPVNKGETVWTMGADLVCRVGRLVSEKKLDVSAEVTVTGPGASFPRRIHTVEGASLHSLLLPEIKKNEGEGFRFISGNVLTGYRVDPKDGFLRFPYRHITIIEDGENKEDILGWASLSPSRFSVKRSFPAFLRGLGKPFDFDARVKGGRRARILSGELDKVFPFDIYPEYLLKAIEAFDIDKMEKLGIYEVAPEDFALPEFVDTSKEELQKEVREGLDRLRNEL